VLQGEEKRHHQRARSRGDNPLKKEKRERDRRAQMKKERKITAGKVIKAREVTGADNRISRSCRMSTGTVEANAKKEGIRMMVGS